MKNNLIKLCTLVLLSASVFSCKKDYGSNLGPLQDSVTDIPVTVTNANTFERFPVVYASVTAGGTFTINLAIPADKGKIKQITKVATSSTVQTLSYTNLNSTRVGTSYRSAAIPGNGTNTISFTSNLTEYFAYRQSQPAVGVQTAAQVQAAFGPVGPSVGPPTTPGGPATGPPTPPVPSITAAPTDIAYYFRIELEDGTTIVPLPVRVRVQP